MGHHYVLIYPHDMCFLVPRRLTYHQQELGTVRFEHLLHVHRLPWRCLANKRWGFNVKRHKQLVKYYGLWGKTMLNTLQ